MLFILGVVAVVSLSGVVVWSHGWLVIFLMFLSSLLGGVLGCWGVNGCIGVGCVGRGLRSATWVSCGWLSRVRGAFRSWWSAFV